MAERNRTPRKHMVGHCLLGTLLLTSISFSHAEESSRLEKSSSATRARLGDSVDALHWEEYSNFNDIARSARSHFIYERFERAASDVQRAMTIYNYQRSRCLREALCEAMKESSGEFDKLAGDLRGRKIVTVKQIEPVVLKAQRQLAKLHLSLVGMYSGKRRYVEAGKELRSAVIRIEDAFQWANRDIGSLAADSLKPAHELALRLIQDDIGLGEQERRTMLGDYASRLSAVIDDL